MPIHSINYQNYITPSDYLKFEQGDTTVRIISKGGTCKMHGMKTSRGFINLGICTEDEKCETCIKAQNEPNEKYKKNYEAKNRWIWIVYLKEFDVVRIMEVGKTTGDTICKLAKEQGDPMEYDLIVTRTGIGLETKYSVKMGKKEPMAEELLAKLKPTKDLLVKKHF